MYLDKSFASWIVAGSGMLLVSGRAKQTKEEATLTIANMMNGTLLPYVFP